MCHPRLLILLLAIVLTLGSIPGQAAVTLTQQDDKYIMENDYVRLKFQPGQWRQSR